MRDTVRYLRPYLKTYKWKYLGGAIFILITNAFRVVNPKIIQHAIDYLQDDFALEQLALFAGLLIVVAMFEGAASFSMRRTLIVASREIENDMRNDYFSNLLGQQASFYHKMPTGDIMSRATNDLGAVRNLVGPGIAYSINTLSAFLFVIPMMFFISPRLTWYTLIPFPIIALLVNRFGKAIYKRFERIQNQLSTLTTKAQENLSGSTIIKWFSREDYEIESFRSANEEYMRRNIDYAKVHAAFHPSLVLTIGICIAVIIYVGGLLVMRSSISLGEFAAFIMYANILIWPFIALGWVIGVFQQGSASLNRMRTVYESVPEIVDSPHGQKPDTFAGNIRFDHFSFQYDERIPVLKDIQLNIPARTTLGIIGPTGSGKSTLINAIPHLYRVPRNMLLIDDIDLNDYSVSYLRDRISIVPQETFLFSDTIRNNIAYGQPTATAEEVEWAAKMADIHEQIMEFPDQYEAVLGEKGINLSGGQKQRVAIARAILCKPNILILDDAFSALDTHTEAKILQRLQAFFPDRTVILVSHRVSTLQHADAIIVLEDGQITERGQHDDLIKNNGLYTWIHEKQLLEAELESVE